MEIHIKWLTVVYLKNEIFDDTRNELNKHLSKAMPLFFLATHSFIYLFDVIECKSMGVSIIA